MIVAPLLLWLAQGPVVFKNDSPAARTRAKLAQHLIAFPGDVNATNVLASWELEENSRPDEALRLLDAVKDSAAPIERLRVLANRTRAEAIRRRLDNGSPVKNAITAHLHFAAGRDREAFAFYRRALKLAPDLPQVHAKIAEIYRRSGHPEWAAIEERLEKGAAPEGDYKLVLDHLEAEETATQELLQFADCWEKLDIQARIASERGDHKAALAFARKAVALDPGNPSAERGLALALFRDKQYAEALPLLEKHQMPELSIALLELGQPEKARKYFRHADPVEEAKLMGRIYTSLNNPMQAIPQLQAQAGKDIDGSLHEILGRAYQALHQPNPAGLALRRASELRKRYTAELEIRPPE